MPQKNKIKVYVENGHYHIYNRGVEKRDIFLDDQDYRVFLHLLKYYLSPLGNTFKHPLKNFTSSAVVRPRPLSNLEGEVTLLTYCLMPNHFHLLIKQTPTEGMQNLMRRLTTTFSMYFNKRYDRVGHLFQGRYKAVLISNDSYLLHLSRYIHLNPIQLTGTVPVSYPYSSYQHYLGLKKAEWVKPEFILKFFNKSKLLPFLKRYPSYRAFVEGYKTDPHEAVGNLAID